MVELHIKLYKNKRILLKSPHIEIIFEMVADFVRKTREVKDTTTC